MDVENVLLVWLQVYKLFASSVDLPSLLSLWLGRESFMGVEGDDQGVSLLSKVFIDYWSDLPLLTSVNGRELNFKNCSSLLMVNTPSLTMDGFDIPGLTFHKGMHFEGDGR